jgi:hypothetical protein
MSFLLCLFLISNGTGKKAQDRFCLEVRGVGEKGWRREARERNDPNNVYACK